MPSPKITRRDTLRQLGSAALAAPFVRRSFSAAPSETLIHASFGASGMAGADIESLTASPHVKLVAVAEVDAARAAEIKQRFPDVRIYDDWRVLLDKEKDLDSVNVSTPDHMHAPIAMSAIQRGLNVYAQKPLTQTIYETRHLTKAAAERGVVSQMGIQIHSHPVHKSVVATIKSGAIGRVKEVHSWSGKRWGARGPKPERTDPVPSGFNWEGWLGVAESRPFIARYYHPGEWRRRLDFGTGTFGDMGCHILDPVFAALDLTAPNSVRSDGGRPTDDSWGVDSRVRYVFPGTEITTDSFALLWYDGRERPPADITALLGERQLANQGSIYLGTDGVLYSPYIDPPVLLPVEQFADHEIPTPEADDHYLQFVEACHGNGKTSTPFSYSGPLTEMVLLGCLATRFPATNLDWDVAGLKVTNVEEANDFVRHRYREGWEVEGL
jgi:predicted dehydrogenase